MRGLEISLVLLLAGCVDDWCDRFSLACESTTLENRAVVDEDGDVWDVDSDCDDQDPLINPSAEEICDGVDNNCDGQIDEGTPGLHDLYEDADGDGFGDPDRHIVRCEDPEGWVDNDDDCDDGDATVSPDATERCSVDYRDEDCDGLVDDDDPSLSMTVDGDSWVDVDGDGYGDPDGYVGRICHRDEQGPPALVDNERDCDDADGSVYPGAMERWYDGLDSDCAGDDDYDADGDGHRADSQGGLDCDDGDSSTYPGADELCDEHDHDCDGRICVSADLSVAHAVIEGVSVCGELGAASAAGDVDGDGVPELILATWGTTQVYVMDSSVTGTMTVDDARLTVIGEMDGLGMSMAAGADGVSGDGYADLVLGLPYDSHLGVEMGTAFVFAGPLTASLSTSQATLEIVGQSLYTDMGMRVAWVDGLTGSGGTDLVVTAEFSDVASSNAGAVYVWAGPVSGSTGLSDAIELLGGNVTDQVGGALAHGDLNADGFADLVVGAPGCDVSGGNAGAAFVLLGPLTQDAIVSSAAGVSVYGSRYSDQAGSTVAAADLDDDGQDDLIIGAPYGASSNQGTVGVFTALGAGDYTMDDATLLLWGEARNDYLGSDLTADADIDGDGVSDLLMGSWSGGDSASGAVYPYTGPWSGRGSVALGGMRLTGVTASDWAGVGLCGVPDLDGDGRDEFLVGATSHDTTATDAGAFFLVYGSAL